ncbi:TauD/TfdA family dioxygenase [Nocardia sp. NPDC046473]|uniref:TauD/TfdA family dioxygenase n=1 Tax=Nocardia sp. NPDC046473 TaxID=3155733 RepID=UPI0033CD21CA
MEGLLSPDVHERYSVVAHGLPRMGEVLSTVHRHLLGADSDGYLVLGCRGALDSVGDDEAACELLTVVLAALGVPLRVFDKWALWKPITSRLDVEPIRAFGVGYNPLHLDLVNTTRPPDISGLLCVWPDPLGEGFSLVSQIRRAVARLDATTCQALAQPVFRDGAFFDVSGVGAEYNPFPILDELPADRGFVRFTAKMLGDRDPDDPATQAARRLEQELIATQRRFRLERGDLLLINQHLCCHGRESLGPGQEALREHQRRQLRQVFVSTHPESLAGGLS